MALLTSRTLAPLVVAGLLLAAGVPARAARLKDIAAIEGMRANQLWGYGLVVGLNGTGDSQQALFTPFLGHLNPDCIRVDLDIPRNYLNQLIF